MSASARRKHRLRWVALGDECDRPRASATPRRRWPTRPCLSLATVPLGRGSRVAARLPLVAEVVHAAMFTAFVLLMGSVVGASPGARCLGRLRHGPQGKDSTCVRTGALHTAVQGRDGGGMIGAGTARARKLQ